MGHYILHGIIDKGHAAYIIKFFMERNVQGEEFLKIFPWSSGSIVFLQGDCVIKVVQVALGNEAAAHLCQGTFNHLTHGTYLFHNL